MVAKKKSVKKAEKPITKAPVLIPMKRKKSAKDKARATLGLPPQEKPAKLKKPKAEPGEIVKRKSKYNLFATKDSPGWASSRVIHWAGDAGFNLEQTRKALTKLCPATKDGISDINLQCRLTVGAGPKSRPASLSKEEIILFKKAAGIK